MGGGGGDKGKSWGAKRKDNLDIEQLTVVWNMTTSLKQCLSFEIIPF